MVMICQLYTGDLQPDQGILYHQMQTRLPEPAARISGFCNIWYNLICALKEEAQQYAYGHFLPSVYWYGYPYLQLPAWRRLLSESSLPSVQRHKPCSYLQRKDRGGCIMYVY